ncbi:MAG: type I-C CRISPR-associated protein Cas5c [Erysipelotrichaceae bacterium]
MKGVIMEKANKVSFKVSGKFALFTDPITRLGGEKSSYPIPTYQALKGILESVYWKPSVIWIIDRCRVMNVIQTQSKGIRPMNYNGGNSLSLYNYLTEVEYQVEAHFIWNEHRPDLMEDHNENKHYLIAKRMIERGGRRDIFLGTRECQGYVEPCKFGEANSYYDMTDEISFGVMFHGYNYPDETGKEYLESRLFQPIMKKGIICFPKPNECTMVRKLRKMKMKSFNQGINFTVGEEGDLI